MWLVAFTDKINRVAFSLWKYLRISTPNLRILFPGMQCGLDSQERGYCRQSIDYRRHHKRHCECGNFHQDGNTQIVNRCRYITVSDINEFLYPFNYVISLFGFCAVHSTLRSFHDLSNYYAKTLPEREQSPRACTTDATSTPERKCNATVSAKPPYRQSPLSNNQSPLCYTHGKRENDSNIQNSASMAETRRSTRVLICETELRGMLNAAATSPIGRSSRT